MATEHHTHDVRHAADESCLLSGYDISAAEHRPGRSDAPVVAEGDQPVGSYAALPRHVQE